MGTDWPTTDTMNSKHFLVCVLMFLSLSSQIVAYECPVSETSRFDCYPEQGKTQKGCEERGCCWSTVKSGAAPECFYPLDFPTYSANEIDATKYGYKAVLERHSKTHYGNDIMKLEMDVLFETDTRLHFKIFDPKSARFEVPIETPKFTNKSTSPTYDVEFQKTPFSFRVKRNLTQGVLFDTSAGTFIFSDQFIQLSTLLPSIYLYGLGEHLSPLLLDLNWQIQTLWTKDGGPKEHTNLYGSHPFYMVMEGDGNAHGVLLLNSNAMDVVLQPTPALTYRTIGGILDFYIFLGPSPTEVIQQYTEVIGRPFMPPYWSLGFHLCRYGYNTADRTFSVVEKMRAAKIPQDVQWNDIDSMNRFLDFTIDEENFSLLPYMIENLHQHGQHYVIMLDPAISNTQAKGTYPPFDDGLANDIFIKNITGDLLIAKVWPGDTVFPDFTNPATHQWWEKQASKFHEFIDFDGIWNDMNEPSNFVFGSIDGCPFNNTYENPPYLPAVAGGSLASSTICMSAQQYWSMHYNVHSLYGYSETMATHNALLQIRNKKAFVLSRSTFPGSGKYTAHWTGDIHSTWQHMYYTVPAIINFNMFGIPMVGADICGFGGNTTEQLCQRWQQLGAFYPFSRNHNSLHSKDQDPTVFSEAMQASTRNALLIRYSLLPYLYTLFHKAHRGGYTVARPLFFEFPTDSKTYSIDTQFLWGEALMITPVLKENATSVEAYIPYDVWYDYYTVIVMSLVFQGYQATMGSVVLDAPMDKINLHVRGGYIIPMQDPDLTTTASRKNKFALIVALSDTKANGALFWDDGDTIDTYEKNLHEAMKFKAENSTITSSVVHDGYPESDSMVLGSVRVFGVPNKPTQVIANGQPAQFTYDSYMVLNITGMSLPMKTEFNITWT
ncbi:lysosomal alpha-glucosidase-like [Glandiceps talaboti]